MILARYILREVLSSIIVVFLVLFCITLATQLNVLLRWNLDQPAYAKYILPILLHSVPHYLSVVVPIAFYFGCVFALGRLHSNYEIITMYSCGMSQKTFHGALLLLTMAFTAIAVYINMYAAPANARQLNAIVQVQRQHDLFDVLTSENFYTVTGAQPATIYIEKKDKNSFSNVYIAQLGIATQQDTFTFAQHGSVNTKKGQRYFDLHAGYQVRTNNDTRTSATTTFDVMSLKLPNHQQLANVEKKEMLSNTALLRSEKHEYREHWYWRVALVLTIPTLYLLSILIGKVAPRQGSFRNSLPAFIILVGYFAALIGASQLAKQPQNPAFLSIIAAPLTVIIVYVGVYTRLRLSR